MMIYIQNIYDILDQFDSCVICHCSLEVSFPKDFPDEWKFCCGCLLWAEMVISPRLDLKILRTIPGFIKAEKYITLVG